MTVTEAVTLIAAVSAAVASISASAIAIYNAVRVAQVHTLVNGMSTRAEQLARDLGNAEGKAEIQGQTG